MERYGKHAEFSLAIGDDRTDEDLFEVVNNFGASVKVGEFHKTHTGYYVEEQNKFAPLLKSLFLRFRNSCEWVEDTVVSDLWGFVPVSNFLSFLRRRECLHL